MKDERGTEKDGRKREKELTRSSLFSYGGINKIVSLLTNRQKQSAGDTVSTVQQAS
jgi:hypothetical protein